MDLRDILSPLEQLDLTLGMILKILTAAVLSGNDPAHLVVLDNGRREDDLVVMFGALNEASFRLDLALRSARRAYATKRPLIV
jgi:hypothetical protein